MKLASLAFAIALLPTAALAQTPTPDPEFQTLDHRKANFVRFDPTVDWTAYKRYRLAPSTGQPCNPAICLQTQDARQLTSAFDKSLDSAFRDVPAGLGPTLEIRPVITAVKETSTKTNIVSFVLIQMPLSYGAASVHYQLIDAESGHLVGEIDSARKARPWNIPLWEALQSFHRLGQTTVLLRGDARQLRKDLKRLAAVPAPNAAAPIHSATSGQ